MNSNFLLTLNPGSSTIKLGLFAIEGGEPRSIGRGAIDLSRVPLILRFEDGGQPIDLTLHADKTDELHELIDETLNWISKRFSIDRFAAVGHRVVHGGDRFSGPTAIDSTALSAIEALAPLAPLHQPQSLRLMRAVRRLRLGQYQVASFDTAFHRTQAEVVKRFALPREMFNEGVKRYGFHGLSYQSIAAQLRRFHPKLASGRIVVAHLGSGASLCGLAAGLSRDTTMAFSTLDGIPMGTRPGALDSGVLLYLLKERHMSVDSLEDLLYHRSGLLGVSGLSGDARELAASDAPEARQAIALFALRVARETAAIATTLGGLDAIVFTAGIGEHQPGIREAICRHLEWTGVAVDSVANARHGPRFDAEKSKVALLVLHTDEEQVMAEDACHVLSTALPGVSP
jgi:acetate kinase